MNQFKKIMLMLVLSGLYSASSLASDFTGQWTGEKITEGDKDKVSMTIWLNESEDEVTGRYCLIYQNGSRTDCSGNDESNIHGRIKSKGIADINFDSWFGGKNGEALLTGKGNQLSWRLIAKPQGNESYIPAFFVLHKKKDNVSDVKFTKRLLSKLYGLTIINHCNDFHSDCNKLDLLLINKSTNDVAMLSGHLNNENYSFATKDGLNHVSISDGTVHTIFNGKEVSETVTGQ
ncbi:hypothetical protein [Erwinia psidii]|uniref:Lipocalin-like domain-containing protein n=1 Tax=Erwinia psidii TaxID=69224 RepID=A0A3N6RTP3_9GAMM|nr:hypothetical protein [Erwinia psidii]RQM36338.1 hypothetical protein EB241_21055 [Erwinia psidii]